MKKIIILLSLIIFSNGIFAQDKVDNTSFEAFWELPIIPIKLSFGSEGVSISMNNSIKTPFGVFGVSGKYTSKASNNNEREIKEKIVYKDRVKIVERIVYAKESDFILIIKKGVKEYVFILDRFDAISFETEGQSKIEASYKKLYIDITNADISDIVFKGKKKYNSYLEDLKKNTTKSDFYGEWKVVGRKLWDYENEKWIIEKGVFTEYPTIILTPNYIKTKQEPFEYITHKTKQNPNVTVTLNDNVGFYFFEDRFEFECTTDELFLTASLLNKDIMEVKHGDLMLEWLDIYMK